MVKSIEYAIWRRQKLAPLIIGVATKIALSLCLTILFASHIEEITKVSDRMFAYIMAGGHVYSFLSIIQLVRKFTYNFSVALISLLLFWFSFIVLWLRWYLLFDDNFGIISLYFLVFPILDIFNIVKFCIPKLALAEATEGQVFDIPYELWRLLKKCSRLITIHITPKIKDYFILLKFAVTPRIKTVIIFLKAKIKNTKGAGEVEQDHDI